MTSTREPGFEASKLLESLAIARSEPKLAGKKKRKSLVEGSRGKKKTAFFFEKITELL